jgi:hypothetical protein
MQLEQMQLEHMQLEQMQLELMQLEQIQLEQIQLEQIVFEQMKLEQIQLELIEQMPLTQLLSEHFFSSNPIKTMSSEQMLFEQISRLREHWFCHRFGIFAGIQIFFFFSILPPAIFTDRSKAKKVARSSLSCSVSLIKKF